MYNIKDNYTHRNYIHYNDDFETTSNLGNMYQAEVYEFAKNLTQSENLKSVIDFGCGAGYKFLKNFGALDTLGIDMPETVDKLHKRYPGARWTSDIGSIDRSPDLLISADAIEHMQDPMILIDFIKRIKPKHIVLSTPERLTMYKDDHNGPPENECHVREWSFDEFAEFISEHFDIVVHSVTNYEHATQMIYCKIKE